MNRGRKCFHCYFVKYIYIKYHVTETHSKLWQRGQGAFCLSVDSGLKIKLWETDKWVYGWVIVSGQSLSQVYSCVKSKKCTPDRDRTASVTSTKSSPKIVSWPMEQPDMSNGCGCSLYIHILATQILILSAVSLWGEIYKYYVTLSRC